MAHNILNLIQVWLLKPQAYKPWVVSVIVIIVLASVVLWLTALFFAYLGDDWNSPAADERSIPAARTY